MTPLVRRVLFLVCAVVLIEVCFYSALAPLLPMYVEKLGLSKAEAGFLIGTHALGTALFSMPAGWAAARWGARSMLLGGLVVLAVACVGFGFANSFPVLCATRFAQGAGGAAAWAAGMSLLMVVAPRERRGEIVGIALGVAVGGAIAGPVIGALADTIGTESTFGLAAIVIAILVVGVLRTPVEGGPQPSVHVRTALRDPRVAMGTWLTALPAAFFGCIVVLVTLRLDDLGASAVAAVFLSAAAAEAALSAVVGRFSDRRGRTLPLSTGLVGIAALGPLTLLPDTAVVLGVAVVVCSVAASLMFTPAMALLADGAEHVGLHQGLAFGLFNLAWAVGQIVDSTGGGGLAEATNDVVPFVVVTALGLIMLVVLNNGGRRRAAQSAASA